MLYSRVHIGLIFWEEEYIHIYITLTRTEQPNILNPRD